MFSDVTSVRPYLLTETALNRLFTTMHGEQNATYSLLVRTAGTPNGPAGVQTAVYTASVPIPGLPGPSNGNFTPAPVYSAPGVRPAPPTAYLSLAAGQPFVDSRSFANIGHSMWAVIVAFVGGVTAQLLAKRKKQAAKSPEDSPV